MKLIKKNEKENLLCAIAEVSGYDVNEILNKKGHALTPWRKVGIYIARQEGRTLKEAADIFKKHFATGWTAVKEVEADLKKLQPTINKILEAKAYYNSPESNEE